VGKEHTAGPGTQREVTIAIDNLKRSEIDWRRKKGELVAALRVLVKPGYGERWGSLRRALRLVGLHRAKRAHVVRALLEVSPDVRMTRAGNGDITTGRYRIIRGITLQVSPDKLHGLLAAKYEVMLREGGMAPEPTPTAMEYKLPAVKGHGRLSELVHRVHDRREEASAYASIVEEYLHAHGWNRDPAGHKRIWQLHCQGVTGRDIAAMVSREGGQEVSHTYVQRALDLHRSRCGIVR
jgi:hypothetical protein